MKNFYSILLLTIFYSGVIEAQSNFQRDYQTFLENQKTPLLSADDDGFILGDIIWKRLYGEKEYYLPPTTKNIYEYESRVLNSKFHFVNIEISEFSKLEM
jgi:hypothetical protein